MVEILLIIVVAWIFYVTRHHLYAIYYFMKTAYNAIVHFRQKPVYIYRGKKKYFMGYATETEQQELEKLFSVHPQIRFEVGQHADE